MTEAEFVDVASPLSSVVAIIVHSAVGLQSVTVTTDGAVCYRDNNQRPVGCIVAVGVGNRGSAQTVQRSCKIQSRERCGDRRNLLDQK
jgi:N-acetylglucosamine kinase-like BadF-type ATPase